MVELSTPWAEFYKGSLQSLWALLPVTGFFLLYRAARALAGRGIPAHSIRPEAARFVDRFAIAFGITIFIDPIATGPITRLAGLQDGLGGSAIAFLFVYLGDFRVFLLLFGLAWMGTSRAALAPAALYAFVVPVTAGLLFAALQALRPSADGQWLWVFHEVLFLTWILWFRERWIPRHVPADQGETRQYLREVCLFVACYYFLWPASDLLVLIGSLDAGWGLRIVPNQLYYGFFIPWVWLRFFRRPR